mmetsp:Transcript_652/g.1139  ORF Transcript_652/g.1139 Transcript_652/m.1139 type:complete len:988 (+) Transcript_652:115-3078(+)|eukprot:CAMPEP_0113623260 /NCGR_PEP_ID=MMETSP0017_2-20120614/11958_1 /TAXON_ID=2856 /ORGANISM="Cylindrotheca closterium" /LENGTH=987 /DNA_ID=CAMNT_0000533189 /DNA_START=86 /DNA_END=3049 /DNA_ORIENTATION=+ /assembly_acc=CAM_ASM_000147
MSPYGRFNEQVFRSSVDKAMKTVQQILEANRNPQMAGDVDHKYENKYKLAEQLSNMAIASHMNCLEQLGLTLNILQELKAAASTGNTLSNSVTLRFQAAEACTFLKEQIVEVPSSTSHKTEKTEETQFGATKKTTSIHSFTKRVKEYHWKVDVKWIMRAFWGSDQDQGTELLSRPSTIIVVTQSNQSPIAKIREHPPVDILLNWFVEHVDPVRKTTVFHIQTNEAKTPRRNTQVEEALDFVYRMQEWASSVRSHFTFRLQQDIIDKHNPVVKEAIDSSSWINMCTPIEILVPVLPIMDDSTTANGNASNAVTTQRISQSQLSIPIDSTASGASVDMTGDDCIKLLNEHVRSLEEKVQNLQRGFPSSQTTSVISGAEAKIVVLCGHLGELTGQYERAVDYIEYMLEQQLFAAIGKRVTTNDLEDFVRYHNARFLQPPPKPFCYAIGRPNHYPFGVVSLEKASDGEPIHTLTRQVMSSPPLKVQLTAATTVNLTGKTHLHGWMNFRSQGENIANSFQLVARARQFSSFLLVVGTMMGADELQPKDAIIVQNKDDVVIPLLLNELPSAKEFKDAIQSLSPEQRRFAEAFRSMQLSSSVFGIAIIQIKPQFERLLGIPEDSLAKEIKLTQDLMELFVEHQVPSDLLSYDGDTSASVTSKEKVDNVKSHVEAVLGVINSEKENQLEQTTMKADMAAASAVAGGFFGSSPAPAPFGNSVSASPFADGAAAGAGGGLFGTPAPAFYFGAPDGAARAAPGGVGGSYAVPKSESAYSPTSPAYSPPPPPPPQDSTPAPASGDGPSASEQSLSGTKRKIQDSNETQQTHHQTQGDQVGGGTASSSALDFSAIPKILDKSIEQFDKESALRSTVIKTAKTWRRKRQENLLKKPSEATLSGGDVRSETNNAFDLLDALSRSGSLSIPYSELHVVLCVSHCFQKSVTDTLIQDNVNPIERLELSTLLLGSVIHGAKPYQLVTAGSDRQRIESTFPALSNG